MAEWNENDHPRDEQGRFADKYGFYRQNSDAPYKSPNLLKKKTTKKRKPRISPQEYEHVVSELATNMSKAERESFYVRKAIGDYIYGVENHGFGVYRIIWKRRISEKIRRKKKL